MPLNLNQTSIAYDPSPYLSQLIQHPTYGYVLPNRLTVPALGCQYDYQLRRFFDPKTTANPQLSEHSDFAKWRGEDNVERLFFTVSGLFKLCDLVGTQQAQIFKQALTDRIQPGQLAPVPPAPPVPPPGPLTFGSPHPVPGIGVEPLQPASLAPFKQAAQASLKPIKTP
ncbi:MAG: hypothetical protein NW220_07395 [Leptolyngbyaceae cyanobacterium bins.349]|nr:hypothetical protein [Leptolyngbyaceae cyanobacterium bins.349]